MKDENFFINEDWLGDAEEVDAFIAKLTELSAELKAAK